MRFDDHQGDDILGTRCAAPIGLCDARLAAVAGATSGALDRRTRP